MSFTSRVLLFALATGGCESDSKPPEVPIGNTDAGPREEVDAGPPLDCMTSGPEDDADGDGFSPSRGDCDDCVADVSPRAFDVPNDGIDNDCDGSDATALPPPCDDDGSATSADPEQAAEALGLCDWVSQRSRNPGVIEAGLGTFDLVEPLASNLQVWFPARFGTITPREGNRLVVLSTGVARDVSVESFTPGCDVFDAVAENKSFTPPEGYPVSSKECDIEMEPGTPAFNPVELQVKLRMPSNASGFSFDSMFFTYEYPYYVCQQYNDFFAVFVDPKPRGNDDENVLFDADDNPIGVNSGLLQVCRVERGLPRDIPCEQGPDLLKDTGYDEGESTCVSESDPSGDLEDVGGAATGWLHTVVPMKGSELVTLRFVLWDSGDALLDSTVLLDNFQWIVGDAPRAPSTGPITRN